MRSRNALPGARRCPPPPTPERLFVKRVLTAAVLVAALLAAFYFLDQQQFRLLVALIVGLAAYEWAALCGGGRVAAVTYAAACTLLYCSILMLPGLVGGVTGAAAAFWLLVAPWWLSRGFLPGPRSVLPLAGIIVIVPAGAAMAWMPRGQLLALLGMVVVADTAAYFCGRAFGHRKLAPAISPGKTWEGAIGGSLGCLIYATICAMLIPDFQARVQGSGWPMFLAAAVLLSGVSIIGDLFESAAKRRAGVKDSGGLLPGHGGILDRIDSATAMLPVAMLLMQATGAT